MFQATRRRLAIWYTAITAVLLLLFASGVYLYVRATLIERVDDTLNHVVEVVQRSLVIEPDIGSDPRSPMLHVNIEASFRDNAETADDDRIDLEWFSPTGDLLWSTLEQPLTIPIHANPYGETVHLSGDQLLRQITKRVQLERQVLGYLRVSHPWFEVTKPSRQLIVDLSFGIILMVIAVAAIGWLLSGLAMTPVRDSYQRLRQFTADASHELRNPIAVIQTNVQVALADPDPDFQREQFQVIERITRRLGRLVDDLLFLARQDSGIAQLAANPVSLAGLLVEVVNEQQAIATDKGLSLTLEVVKSEPVLESPPSAASPLCLVQGDRDQLMRLFTNLVSNAIQYTPTGGVVTVKLRQTELSQPRNHAPPQLEVEIKDTGIGISPDALPYIFDRFYRADPARSSRGDGYSGSNSVTGSGLGLAIASVIAQNHRGSIRVESQLSQGTTVTVMLPAHATEVTAVAHVEDA